MDDTLYSLSSGINREYGTTMAGLKALAYEFDNDEYHAFVHGRLPYGNLCWFRIICWFSSSALFCSLDGRQIFTNADKAHAHQVLGRLGLEDCFEGIICFETLNPPPAPAAAHTDAVHLQSRVLCKPSTEAFDAAFSAANINPEKTIFFDDSARNIATAKAKGLHTVIVGSSELVAGADCALNSIHNMREAIPEIWEGEGEQPERVLQSSVATVVLA